MAAIVPGPAPATQIKIGPTTPSQEQAVKMPPISPAAKSPEDQSNKIDAFVLPVVSQTALISGE